MTSETDEAPAQGVLHCTVLPGDHVVARVGGAHLLVDAPAVGASREASELLSAFAVLSAEQGSISPLIDAPAGPGFAAVEVADSTARVLLRGSADAPADLTLTVAIFASAAAPTPKHVVRATHELVERIAPLRPGAVLTITVGPPPPPAPVCGPTALHLLGGAVPGAGMVLRFDDEIVEGGEIDGQTDVFPADAPTNEEPTGVSPLFAATEHDVELVEDEPADTGPQVEGRRCAFGHLNAPNAGYCARCGALVDRRGPLETGPRPPLALLVADDGTAFVIDSDLVIGRDPAAYLAQRAGRASDGPSRLVPIILPDRTGSLSRAHLEIRLDGWQLLAVDVGSANGTWVQPPGAVAPLRLPPGQPVPLTPGSTVHIGGRNVYVQEIAGA